MYISFKLFDKARLDKIMRVAKPINLNSHLHYGRTWIPFSEAVDKNGEVVWEKAHMVGVFNTKHGIDHPHSRPHAKDWGVLP